MGDKEWVKFARTPSGSFVTVTLQRDNVVARWTEKVLGAVGVKGQITTALTEARSKAKAALDELAEATS